jgi:hypothetical protein
MSEDAAKPKKGQSLTERELKRREDRAVVQAQALRANLQRRKTQLRARQDVAAIEAGVSEESSE